MLSAVISKLRKVGSSPTASRMRVITADSRLAVAGVIRWSGLSLKGSGTQMAPTTGAISPRSPDRSRGMAVRQVAIQG